MATIGVVGNGDYIKYGSGKAGRTRHLGIRPQTRGFSDEPIDHPRWRRGKTNSEDILLLHGVCQLKGYKTRKKKASDKLIISRKRSKV